MAEFASMQPYLILYKTTLQLGVRNLPKVFYTAATWRGIEPRIYDTQVRRSTSKPPCSFDCSVWLRDTETEISAALWALVAREGLKL